MPPQETRQLGSSFQVIASLHVVLSLIALCFVPQTVVLLPIGAFIATVGLFATFRSKWEIHFSCIVTTFALQSTFWSFSIVPQNSLWVHGMAIGCSLMVGLTAAFAHYQKKYRSKKFEIVPLLTHLLNWGLLAWNIYLHRELYTWAPLALGIASLAGFFLARSAKRKGIYWLYQTDTLLSQLTLLGAIMALNTFSIKISDLTILALVEIIIFNLYCSAQKENFLLLSGHALQWICSLVILCHASSKLLFSDETGYLLRLGVVGALNWGFYFAQTMKKFVCDKGNTCYLGACSFLAVYIFGFEFLSVHIGMSCLCLGLGFLRKGRKDVSWHVALISMIFIAHAMNWRFLLDGQNSELSFWCFTSVIVMDMTFILFNFVKFQLGKTTVSSLLVYGLGIHVALVTYFFGGKLNPLIPGLMYS